MKKLSGLGLLVLLPLFATAQTISPYDAPPKPKPLVPVLVSEHSGPGRIGVRLAFDKETGLPYIAGLIRGGPAADAGFKIGDIIVKIDKNFTTTLSQDEVRLALHGDPGIGVELTVQRGDDPRLIVRAIDRRIIPWNSEEALPSTVVPETIYPTGTEP